MEIDPQAARRLENALLGGPRTLKRREVAAKAGVSLLSARKIWRALGFANVGEEEVAFTEADRDGIETMTRLVRDGIFDEQTATSLTRSIGQTTDRMVVWQIEAMVEYIARSRGVEDAEARAILIQELPEIVKPIEDMLFYAWRRELAAAVGRLAVRAESGLDLSEEGRDGTEDDAGLPLARAVGFADLVSYTRLSQRMSDGRLAEMVQHFEGMCADIINAGGGRVVKTVGDEVFFNAETPEAGAEIALSLSERIGADEMLPQARVSLVWGRVLSRLGDVFGPTVNLAARLTAIAEPGSVLTDAATASVLADDERFLLLPQGVREVRGFGPIQPVILARLFGESISIDS